MDFNRLIPSEELSSSEYHGEGNSFSSSQLKTILEDPEIFYKKYVSKEVAKESSSNFDVGSYFHTALLEPEKIDEEFAIYQGAIKRGKEYEKFCEENKGKVILSKSDKANADTIIAAVRNSPISMDYLKSSKPEVSAFVEIYVLGKEIFGFRNGECFQHLLAVGWVPGSGDFDEQDIKDFGVKLIIKVRADALGIGTGVISDLKSTNGNAIDAREMQTKVSAFKYELSAALYLDVFTLASGENYHTFVWIFASKDKGNCRSFKASDKYIMIGRAKWRKALFEIAKYVQAGWVFNDELGEIHPPNYELDWLIES